MKKILIKIFIAFFIAFSLSLSYLYMPKVFFSLDNRLRDFMFTVRGELPKSHRIVIVDIDEKSLKKYGQWPWDRKLLSTLFSKISSDSPGIIGLDMVFSEADRSSPHILAKKYPQIKKNLPNYDEILAQCIKNNPIIGGYIFTFSKNSENEAPLIPAVFIEQGLKENSSIMKPKGVITNIPILQTALYSSGFFNNTPDKNGMIRSVPLIMKYKDVIYPSLALEMVRIFSGENIVKAVGYAHGMEYLSFGKFTMPVDDFGRLFVNFRGPKKHFKYISAVDILNGKVKQNELTDKFVLVGTSALGLYDLRSIAYDSNIPGVEIHANVIDNLLTGDFLRKPQSHQLYTLVMIWILVFSIILIFHFIRSWLILPLAILMFFALGYMYYILLFSYGLILNLLFPIVAFIITLITSIAIDYFMEQKQKMEVKKILGKKVSKSVMDYLLKHANEDIVSSREVEATVFFSDIQGFTAISEKMDSPDELIALLNTYMTPMVDNIISHQGTIDKFIGDAIMAYWNAPLSVKNHADKAVQSAIDQITMLEEINIEIQAKYSVNIHIGIGLHTGVVTAGDMGAEGRSDFTVIGDNVNIASRLEGMTRYYDVDILISAETYKRLEKDKYLIRPIDLVEVKGKNKSVEIFEVICSTKNISQEELTLYLSAIKYFRAGEVVNAKTAFIKLEAQNPSKLYSMYVKRCQYFIDNLQEAFTPVLKMTTK